ncbi:hypothetical protein NPIL_337951 [Nephila pilipes]|uniref:Uncharacterized protein n=1 Tax=Nephila pilipes TaxID=299642 RepID=A0A8X6U8F7_NEPPI|nr:hypothetical protein NPIL_337951 [Nephila pilipes]
MESPGLDSFRQSLQYQVFTEMNSLHRKSQICIQIDGAIKSGLTNEGPGSSFANRMDYCGFCNQPETSPFYQRYHPRDMMSPWIPEKLVEVIVTGWLIPSKEKGIYLRNKPLHITYAKILL